MQTGQTPLDLLPPPSPTCANFFFWKFTSIFFSYNMSTPIQTNNLAAEQAPLPAPLVALVAALSNEASSTHEASPSPLREAPSASVVEGQAMPQVLATIPSLIVSAPVDSVLVTAAVVSLVMPVLATVSPSLAPIDIADSPPNSSAVSSAHQTTPSLADGQSESGLDLDVAPAAGNFLRLRSLCIIY